MGDSSLLGLGDLSHLIFLPNFDCEFARVSTFPGFLTEFDEAFSFEFGVAFLL